MTATHHKFTSPVSKDVHLVVYNVESNKYVGIFVSSEEYENSTDHEELENQYYDYLDKKLTAQLAGEVDS